MVRFLIASLLFLATALPAAADFETGLEAFRNGDYKTAFTLWEPLAKAGDPEAQFSLGILYRRGLGVEPDYRQAMGWFERAAGRGHPSAQIFTKKASACAAAASSPCAGIGVPRRPTRLLKNSALPARGRNFAWPACCGLAAT